MNTPNPNLDALLANLRKAFDNAAGSFTELARQLTALQQCRMAGMEVGEIAELLGKITREAQDKYDKLTYINYELSFEAQLRATGSDRKTFAMDWLEQDCTDEDLDLYNNRIRRK